MSSISCIRGCFATSARRKKRSSWRNPRSSSIRSIPARISAAAGPTSWRFRQAEAAPHMELACELNDNDAWTLLSERRLPRLLRIDRAGAFARRAGARGFARAVISGVGLPQHHPRPLRRLCRRNRGGRSGARGDQDVERRGGLRRFTNSAIGTMARLEAAALHQRHTFVLGRDCGANRRNDHALVAAGSPDRGAPTLGGPARQLAWRRASRRAASSS